MKVYATERRQDNLSLICGNLLKISKDRFVEVISKRFGSHGSVLKSVIMVLYDMMRRHASYPFWTELPEQLCEDSFIRVLALLRSEPYSWIHAYTRVGGSWGGHSGTFMSRRNKTEQDHKRRLFRGLAEQIDEGAGTPIHIVVPRFKYDSRRRVHIVKQEDERSVELSDVLAGTEPDKDGKTASPFRESYSNILPKLLDIQYLPHLSQMGIRRTVFKALITLLIAADSIHRSSVGWATRIDQVNVNNGTSFNMMNTAGYSATHLLWKDVDAATSDKFVSGSIRVVYLPF
jgi:hypothetical protein